MTVALHVGATPASPLRIGHATERRSLRRQQPLVVFRFTVAQAAVDDLLAERRQIRVVELLQLLAEEAVEHLGALVVRLNTDFRLRFDLQEPARDLAAL